VTRRIARPGWSGRGGIVGAIVAVTVLGLMIVPTNLASAATPAAPMSVALAQLPPYDVNITAANLTIENLSSPYQLSPLFWGTTVSPEADILRNESELFNATSANVVLWPGANSGDLLDPIPGNYTARNGSMYWEPNGILYGPGGTSFRGAPTSEAEFVAWCESIHCKAIMQVPGEVDDPALAAEIVSYTTSDAWMTINGTRMHGLDFSPAYWEIGNEPELYKHWGPGDLWGVWNDTHAGEHPAPTPWAYAWEVVNYSTAMRAADPSDNLNLIGLPAAARQGSNPYTLQQWIYYNVRIAGPYIQAVGFHEYPAAGSGAARPHTKITLHEFYDTLTSSYGLPGRISQVQGAILNGTEAIPGGCTNQSYPSSSGPCHIPIFVTELGSALSHRDFGQVFSLGFPGALATTASIIQAMTLNVTNVDLFASIYDTNNSWTQLTGALRPVYLAYADMLSHLGNYVYPVNVSGPFANVTLNQSLFAIATDAPSQNGRNDLLVDNVDFNHTAAFRPELPGLNSTIGYNDPVEIYWWNSTPAVAGTACVPVDSYITVMNDCPVTPSPVGQYVPGGLAAIGTLDLAPQSMVVVEAYPTPAVPLTVVETGVPATFPQYGVPTNETWFFTVNGRTYDSAGTNLSILLPPQSLSVGSFTQYETRTPLENLSFSWERIVPYVSAPASLTSFPTTASIRFVTQYEMNITSSEPARGYVSPDVVWANASQPLSLVPVATNQSAFIRWTSDNASILRGAYSGTDPDITIIPKVGSLSVFGGPIDEMAHFAAGFPVAFNESGLPPGTPWSVLVRNVTTFGSSATGGPFTSLEANGSFGFHVNQVPGYRAAPTNASFNVTGNTTYVNITFVKLHPPPPSYAVTFVEVGLPNGTPWAVRLRGVEYSTTRTEVSALASNGSYGFNVTDPLGYQANYTRSGLYVAGGPLTIPITYLPRHTSWAIHWVEKGLWAGIGWGVAVNGTVISTTGSWASTLLANGTYSFQIVGTDYVPHPDYGTVYVQGQNLTLFDEILPFGVPVTVVNITFTLPPIPALLVLVLKGAAVGGVIGLAGWATISLLQRRGRKSGPPDLSS
jgi:hypothetical protein